MNSLYHQIKVALNNHVTNTWDNVLSNLNTKDMKTTWNITKKIMHQRRDLPPLNLQNGKATTPEDKAEAFANYLEQTFTPNNDQTDNKFVKETEEMVSNFLQHAPAGEIRKAVPVEIAWQIRHLKNKKAQDLIPYEH